MKKVYTIVFAFSVLITIVAIILTISYGLKFGVDFKGGSVLELSFKERPPVAEVQKTLSLPELKEVSVSQAGERDVIIKMNEISEDVHQQVIFNLNMAFPNSGLAEKRFDSVGPIIGQELKQKSITAVIIVLISVIVYIAIVFRRLSRSLSPWAMGVSAIFALIHDVTIPIGVFALLGHYLNIEISAVFVAAILTILGYSVSDTVVVFDRVRENIIRGKIREEFGVVVHRSIMQTLSRSLNTTFTTLLSLIAIYLFGGESIKYFALALIIGIFLGAYSSIFVASPILVWWTNRSRKTRT